MATIKPIEGRSVHQIQSGQVIGDGLTSAVKELVENSLDAHATSIEVRFKNYGLDAIEVMDNGDGITKDNFEGIALKHYTSKLCNYEDLENVQTFGFRGEALSSLCALSILTIMTATKDDVPKGSKLEFETSGKLRSISVVAAQKGTTVISENLFSTLPVRRKELERNIKREYTKVLGFLQAYASISTGVKFSVFNIPQKGKKTLVFSTKANPTTKENIANVFGAKTLSALVPLELEFEMHSTQRPPIGGWTGIKRTNETKKVRIVGHISKPVVGEGRLAPDRQMFFVNQRPCNLPQVSRAFNEVYKQFNMTQSPFIFADLQMDTNAYDVNVSPDKRTILLHDQNDLLESLKASLTELFNSHEQHVPHTQLGTVNKLPAFKPPSLLKTHTTSTVPSSTPPSDSPAGVDDEDISTTPPDAASQDESSFGKSLAERFSERHARDTQSLKAIVGKANSIQYTKPWKGKQREERSSSPPTVSSPGSIYDDDIDEDIPLRSSPPLSPAFQKTKQYQSPQDSRHEPATITIGNTTITSTGYSPARKKQKFDYSPALPTVTLNKALSSSAKLLSAVSGLAAPGTQVDVIGAGSEEEDLKADGDEDGIDSEGDNLSKEPELVDDVEMDTKGRQCELNFEESILPTGDGEEGQEDAVLQREIADDSDEYIDEEELRARERRKVAKLIEEAEVASVSPSVENKARAEKLLRGRPQHSIKGRVHRLSTPIDEIKKFAHRIHSFTAEWDYMHSMHTAQEQLQQNTEAQSAEERLTLTISKSDFAKMRIIGQFNRGFIITTRSTPPSDTSKSSEDLFIIDQHASDEKYNFETLQATTMMRSQPLVRPKPLDLMAMDEEIVRDNLPTLKANGFTVEVNEDAPTGQKCKLLTLPMSENTVFDLKDLEELIHLMSIEGTSGSSLIEGRVAKGKGEQTIVRPSKVRKTFAMRACRSSVMVGKALTKEQMCKIVRHMGELDKPWNCPHGRPTMRHLCDLGDVDEWREFESGSCDWRGDKWVEILESFRAGEFEQLDEEQAEEMVE